MSDIHFGDLPCRCTICGRCKHDHLGRVHTWTNVKVDYPKCKHCGRLVENRATPSPGAPRPEWWVHVDSGGMMCRPFGYSTTAEPEEDQMADYENRITWETNCGEHARLLDACRAADEKLERVRSVLDDMENGLGEEISAAKLRTALEARDNRGPRMDAKNIKVAPYGDVVLTTCTTRGTYVSDETMHTDWHRRSEFSESETNE